MSGRYSPFFASCAILLTGAIFCCCKIVVRAFHGAARLLGSVCSLHLPADRFGSNLSKSYDWVRFAPRNSIAPRFGSAPMEPSEAAKPTEPYRETLMTLPYRLVRTLAFVWPFCIKRYFWHFHGSEPRFFRKEQEFLLFYID